jgi:hypothetical protein
MNAVLRAASLAVACGLAACGPKATGPRASGDLAAASDTTAIRTTQAAYPLQDTGPAWQVRVVATYTNRTGRVVYARTAGAAQPTFHLDRYEDGRWTLGFAPVVLLIASPPTVVPPGGSHTDTLTILAAKPGLGEPRFTGATVPGTYRLVYDLFATEAADGVASQLADPLPLELRTSNPFQLQ